ncbi:hypothetical protein CAEBREN_30247 [Caenorhabditis brenneri]|uniref:NR LBD domain-containing protein n=1 Tax=Caenorhabditis brenneri TaxID=135651 RepID=G0MUB2_CAEBE|nr:hypothetical protein CAEBREN_30247 [Caenorhabditis brenneri]
MTLAESSDLAHRPNTLVTPMEKLCSMIRSLLVLDSHRYDSLERMRSNEDPTIRDLISRSVSGFAVDRMGENTSSLVPRNSRDELVLSQWSFFGVWTSIEFLNSLEFMSLLNPDDKTLILKSYAMNSYLLSSAFQSVIGQNDRMINPDGSQTFSDRVRELEKISATSVNRIQKSLVAKLRELQITPEEYILIMLVLFCTPQTSELSPYAREIVSEQQRKYCNALQEYCMLTHKAQGPSRFQDIISLGGVLAKSFEDVHHLVTMLQIFHPTSHNSKKLFVESLNK